MKRSASETHDLESANIPTQKVSRGDETVTGIGGGGNKDPMSLTTDSWTETALPVMTTLCTRDIVQKVLAPLLDLETLFNLSLVNRRLRTLLHNDPLLEAAKGYKGIMADYPDYAVEHMSNLRVTEWMARRWKATFPVVVEFNGGVYSAKYDYDHFLKHLVWPLLQRSKLPDEELGHHMKVIVLTMFPDWVCENRAARMMNNYLFSRESFTTTNRDTLLENIAHAACKRIHDPVTAMTLIKVFVTAIKIKTGADNVKPFWDRALLFAQISGNARLADAIVSVHGLLQPAENHPRMMLLMACASGKLDFFEREYARLGKCVPLPELTLFAKLCEQTGMVRYLIDVHCLLEDLEKIAHFIHTMSNQFASVLLITVKIAKSSLFSAGFNHQVAPEDGFEFRQHFVKLSSMMVDAYIRKRMGNPNDAFERIRVEQIFLARK